MGKRIGKMIDELSVMIEQLQDRIDNAGESDKSQAIAERNQDVLDSLEAAKSELESAMDRANEDIS